MTKKDIELIAGAIVRTKIWAGTDDINGIKNVSQSLADALQKQNPQFNREKFLKACGVEA